MKLATSRVTPSAAIYAVEVIDTDGFAWLYGRLQLHEALRMSAYFEGEAPPGKEPRILIPSQFLTGLKDE